MLPTRPHPALPLMLVCLTLSACAHQPGSSTAGPAATESSEPSQASVEIYTYPSLANRPELIRLQIGRYAYISAKPSPEQITPLLAIIDVQVPDTIHTVSDTANYLLQFSGYQLGSSTTEPEVLALLRRNIPAVHRRFQQVVLRDALLALGGNGFRLIVDPVHRWVAYQRDPKFSHWQGQ